MSFLLSLHFFRIFETFILLPVLAAENTFHILPGGKHKKQQLMPLFFTYNLVFFA
jgi:hypothetical protein